MHKKVGHARKVTKLELALAGFVLISSLIVISCLVSLRTGHGNSSTTSALPGLKPALPGGLSEVTAPEASPLGAATHAVKSKQSRNSRRTGDPVAVANEEVPSAAPDFSGSGVLTPVAFVDPSPDQVLTEEQVTAWISCVRSLSSWWAGLIRIHRIRRYLFRWEYAQRRLDDEFRSFFGEDALNQQQLRAVSIEGQE